MKKIKVLHYGLSDNCGGIENVVFSWFKNKPDDVVFDFVNDTDEPLAYESEFRKGGSSIFKVSGRYRHPFRRFNDFKRIISQGDYDYLHMHVMNIDELGPVIVCGKTRTKVIVHCHSMNLEEVSFKEKILLAESKLLGLGRDYLRLSCSQEAGEKMFGDKSFEVIPNGVDFKRFVYDIDKRNEVRKTFGIEEDIKVIGHIGHDCVEKNYPFLIPTMSRLIKEHPDYRLMLIGNVCYSDNILQMLKQYEIYDKTILVGRVNDTSAYYSAMDVFFLPSIAEGFPVSLVEAQVNGLPCITSKVVTREVEVTDRIVFCDFDEEDVKKQLYEMAEFAYERSGFELSDNLNIVNTSRMLVEYYLKNE